MATLNLGTFNTAALHELLPQAERCLGRPGSPSEWRFTDGDGWEEWGEGRVDHEPERIVVDGDSVDLMQDVAYLLGEDPSLLQPMTYPNQMGVIAVITTYDEDLGEDRELFVVTDADARHFIRTLLREDPDANRNEVWKHPKWRARQGLDPVNH